MVFYILFHSKKLTTKGLCMKLFYAILCFTFLSNSAMIAPRCKAPIRTRLAESHRAPRMASLPNPVRERPMISSHHAECLKAAIANQSSRFTVEEVRSMVPILNTLPLFKKNVSYRYDDIGLVNSAFLALARKSKYQGNLDHELELARILLISVAKVTDKQLVEKREFDTIISGGVLIGVVKIQGLMGNYTHESVDMFATGDLAALISWYTNKVWDKY